jgi:hypothetical protein
VLLEVLGLLAAGAGLAKLAAKIPGFARIATRLGKAGKGLLKRKAPVAPVDRTPSRSTSSRKKIADDDPATPPKKTKPPPDNYKTYETHGIKENPMLSPEGRFMVKDFERKGYLHEAAVEKTAEYMGTGSTRPLANPVEVGDRLYKVVPEGGRVGPNSAYFMTESELKALKGLDADAIGSRLGLPLESQQAGRFEVLEVRATSPTIVYDAKIAPTSQNGWHQTGGGTQTLITDRSVFSAPIKTGIKIP